MFDLVAYVDGGSHGNPGPSGIGVVIEGPDGETTCIAKWIGHQDNNVAEYVPCWRRCSTPLRQSQEAARVLGLEVVVKQMTGEYSCRSPRLHSLNWTCRKLARAVEFSISYISRAEPPGE